MNRNRVNLKTFALSAPAAALLAALPFGPALANNISVANVSLVNPTSTTYDVKFDLSWDNSWFTAGAPSLTANWDAAWVFIKFSTRSATSPVWGPWNHATLLGSGDSLNAGAQEAYGDSPLGSGTHKGVFLYRSSAGTGTNAWTGTTLRWNFAADNVSSTAVMQAQVFAIEMVYVSSGAFYAGSGGTGVSEFYAYPTGAYPVGSEAAITVGTAAGDLYYNSSSYGGDQAGPIPAAFPKGYNAFYIMKSEISQRQYCDFLNTLTATQAANRVDSGGHFNGYRNFIKLASNGEYGTDADNNAGSWGSANYALMNEASDGGWTACNYLSWADVAAYADWAALRPFTELEFEKAARGGNAPVPDEYAWGSTAIQEATGISSSATNAEIPSNSAADCVYNSDASVQGPLRSGSMAQAATTRVQAGAGYSGALDLSGNNWERPVTVGNATGRAFDGSHGTGALDSSGNASNMANWPGTNAVGAGFRGGNWYLSASTARLSDRNYAANTDSARSYNYGGRCARTSP